MSAPIPETADSSDTGLDQLCINTIRTLSLDAVQQAESGHPGLPLGAAPMAYVLWTRFMRHNPANPKWENRDRFLLSAGHGSMLLYSLLHLTGYDLSLDEIKRFRQFGSKTPGHPEYGMTPGVEITTGPLGQGFANGVGMAMGGAHLAAKFNQPDFKILDHYVYAIVSDGDLMEGVASEAASLAGHLKLGKLIYLYDDNHVTIEGFTRLAFSEDVPARFEAYGWHTSTVADGNDLNALEAAIREAQSVEDRPSLISVKTTIGFGMPTAGTRKAHSDAPGEEAVRETKRHLGWPEDKKFFIPEEALNHFREAVARGAEQEQNWRESVKQYTQKFPELGASFETVMSGDLPDGWETHLPSFEGSKAMATRAASGEVINSLAPHLPMLVGGSADLGPSNNTDIKEGGDFEAGSYQGRIVHWGIREHAMGSTMTGMSLNGGLIPFGGTFMCFSDYMRPAIRLAAFMKQRVIFIYTHDSIGLGQDGPTHQPIEQLSALRAIPNMTLIRPADASETGVAWKVAVEHRDGPVALVLTRQKLGFIDRETYTSAEGVEQGAYVLADPAKGEAPQVVLMASGSEVALVLKAHQQLAEKGVPTRVVSMPSMELFRRQSEDYRESVLPAGVPRVAIEAGHPMSWYEWVAGNGTVLGLTRFGASAPFEKIYEELGITVDRLVTAAMDLVSVSEVRS